MQDLKDIAYFNLSKLKKFVKQKEHDPKVLKEVTALVQGDDKILSMRAAWVLAHVSYSSPENIYPLLPQLLKFLKKDDQHSGAIRSILRIFHEIDIPEKYCSEIFDLCIAHVKNAGQPHAVRVYAIINLVKICQKYPELKSEVELILSELKAYPQAPSINACIKKQGKILAKI